VQFISKKVVFLVALLASCFASTVHLHAQFYSGSQVQFGKNRIQYQNFLWTSYTYNRYDVYFYPQGKELAQYVSQSAEEQLKEVEALLQYTIEDHIEFVVFNKHSDFKQSNIGYSADDQYNIGGKTRIIGSKIILYYEGDHAKLDAQIRAGIAQLIINQIMYGGSVRDMVTNSTVLTMPDWYVNGLVAYIANDWNPAIDSRVKDGILSGRFDKIAFLEGEDALYAGHAFWKHIANQYGNEVISNILYMTQATHSVDNATRYVIGMPISSVWDNCVETFIQRYTNTDAGEIKELPEEPALLAKPKKTRVYSQFKISPTEDFAVYATNEMGQYKVWLYSFGEKEAKQVFKAEHKVDRINDYSYPLIAWHPAGKLFSFIIERKGYIVMKSYNVETGEFSERNITGFEKIVDYSYSDDGKTIVMSAVKKGQTDVFVLTAASSAFYQITNDIYDDLTPRFVHNSAGVVFASNRPTDTLSADTKKTPTPRQALHDIFLFDMISKSPILTRVTNTANSNESFPADYDSTHVSYLSDENGINNRFVAHIDKVIAFIDTSTHYRTIVSASPTSNYSRSIVEQDVNKKAGTITEILFFDGKYRMYTQAIKNPQKLKPITLANTSYRNYTNEINLQKEEAETNRNRQDIVIQSTPIENKRRSDDSKSININNYVFEDEIKPAVVRGTEQGQKDSLSTIAAPAFAIAKQKNYYTSFSIDYVVSQLDNSYLSKSYQKFTGGGSPIYLNSGLSAFFKAGISDLFEDYQLVGGTRFSSDFSTNEFFLTYSDRKKRIDKDLTLYRQKLENTNTANTLAKIFTHEIRYTARLPFSEVNGLRGSVSYRNNMMVYTSTDAINLAKKNTYENWATTLLEYVFDNTRAKGLNLYNGFRGKLFAEYSRQVDKKQTNFFVVGTDLRYYQKIHRDFIWANRFAASTSFGDKKLIYYMGGVDNWFLPAFDNTTRVANAGQYAYQTLATNVRGFKQNTRNGNSFAVINSELRLPIFKYFFPQSISSDFIRNFQLIGFGDVGVAWAGASPYSDEHVVNTTYIGSYQTPLIIALYSKHDPVIGGVGWGLRTRLFGYFVRLDRAWGIQDGTFEKQPITYLSLSLDF
jgi:hypothetical protein